MKNQYFNFEFQYQSFDGIIQQQAFQNPNLFLEILQSIKDEINIKWISLTKAYCICDLEM